ncbi:unnamed protein product [Porites evermanni]|uniref:Beta-lactamase-related domain-containing protein n=1 Tax=Porites evermanni TaxID=104178 RepID=A0ABN8MJ45_9CNID|nr:unnamed protein product [Porites evermanni]
MASVENLVIESIQFTNNRTLRKWQIVTAIACIVAIVVTALLIWQVSKDDRQCNVKTHNTVNQNGGKESGTKQEQPAYWRPCPRLPSLIALPETIPEPLSKALSRIGELVNNTVNSTAQLPAISVSVFYQNRTLWTGHYGSKEYRRENKPLLELLGDWFIQPEFSIQNPYTMKNITIRQIASQMSGLPREAPCFYVCANVTSQQVIKELANRSLVMTPGVMPSYSNLGYALLGRLLTEKLLKNQTFESWVIGRILRPLNMTNTGFDVTEQVQQNMAFPHDDKGKRMPFMIIDWVAPAGQMYSTLEDLTKLGMMFSQPNKQNLFRPSSLREMMYPMNIAPDGVTLWGAPWEMTFIEQNLVRKKGGAIDSYSVTTSVVPELQLGINILVSSPSFIPRGARKNLNVFYKILLPALNQTLFDLQGSSRFPVDPKPYVGNYSLNKTDAITLKVTTSLAEVVAKEDGLVVFYSGRQFEVRYIGHEFLFQAQFAKSNANCAGERLGTYEDFYFSPFNNEGYSTGFKVPGYPMIATRIS